MTAAIVIAAGVRDGAEAFQPLLWTGMLSAVQRLVLTFQQAGLQRVVVAAGQDTPALEKHLAHMGVEVLQMPDEIEMLESVKTALRYLHNHCTRACITPVNVPLFTEETVRTLCGTQSRAVSPVYRGRVGHPLLLAQECFEAILAYTGGGGLRGALRQAGVQRSFVKVDDPGTVLDTQREQDFKSLIEGHSLHKIHPRIKLRLAREQAFFGPGTLQLLRLIQSTGSVRMACSQMGISYSKGWKMIASMEQALGFGVVQRQQGGAKGGSASLSPAGEELVKNYCAFAEECREAVKTIFERYFGDFGG